VVADDGLPSLPGEVACLVGDGHLFLSGVAAAGAADGGPLSHRTVVVDCGHHG
jgi:hypothetical protein